MILEGWPDNQTEIPIELRKYWTYREQLSCHEGLIFKNDRLLIPKSMVKLIFKHCHLSHKGVEGTLRLARDYVFWPGMTKDVYVEVTNCKLCRKKQKDKQEEAILLQVPERPWSQIASDIFHLNEKDYLVIADTYSGYFDFAELKNMISAAVIKTLKKWFAAHGIPDELLTDNGSQYNSEEFRKFRDTWQFKHRFSSPNFPRSNELAETYVQEAKNLLTKCLEESSDIYLALLHHRNTPRQNIGSPVQRLMGRRTRTLLPSTEKLLLPKVIEGVKENMTRLIEKEKEYADKNKKEPVEFPVGKNILYRKSHREWLPATVVENQEPPRSVVMETPDGKRYRRNSWFIRKTLSPRYRKSHRSINKPPQLRWSIRT